ncbi:endonuclease/exonuclease/phosphatase family protein [Tellurirhabdus bombi]|uniref:endonuclease/exonuclease/phosphatase family protein n=1 Tax=Tellurirhabdus bombi TaxID=2907205 RepID=UPI001F325384|nr:endonuclease/exonuclease/phosphatase family protein [Tellurirhabdus bombi]
MNFKQLIIALGEFLKLSSSILIKYSQLVLRKYRQFPYSYSALIYLFITVAFSYHPVFSHWVTGFVMMSLPVATVVGFVACIYLFYKKQKVIATAGIVWVLFTLPVAKRIFGTGNGTADLITAPALKVLSFNSECFENPTHDVNFADLKADIACFQEYSPNKEIENQYTDKLAKLSCFDADREIGLALFSRYPIVNQYGRIWARDNGPDINGFLCADIAYGLDTVRVVNVHLWSMGVRINQAIDALKDEDFNLFTFEILDTFKRLKEGFEKRDEQVKEVESYVAGSRYPVIICGDFNEIPFSYSYGKLSLSFRNAFEEAGEGLGFTLNRHPYCARIDQQFFSADWQVKSCQTMPSITFSDHYPLVAQYILKKPLSMRPQLAVKK